MQTYLSLFFFFFFNDTATTEIYTLSLHDALPISTPGAQFVGTTDNQPLELKVGGARALRLEPHGAAAASLAGGYFQDRKSTRLNSSHSQISYAVFCLKKKKQKYTTHIISHV